MKTPYEWLKEYEEDRKLPLRKLSHRNGEYVRAIQRDAYESGRKEGLLEAADIVIEYVTKGTLPEM